MNNNGTITNNGSGSGTTTFSAAIGPNVQGVFQNSATSTLILNGANTFTTGLNIPQGTVQVGNATGVGAGLVTIGSLGNSGTLNLNGQTETIVQLATAGTAANQTITSSVTGGVLNYTGATVSTFGGVITGSTASFTSVTVNNPSAVLTLTNANLYGGGTIVTAGTLRAANGTNGSATGTNGVTLNGGTLGGFSGAGGSIGGLVSAGTGSHFIAPGAGLTPGTFGTLNLNGGLTTNNFTTLQFNLNTTTPNGNGIYVGDVLNVGSSGQNFTVGTGTQIAFGTDPTTVGDYRPDRRPRTTSSAHAWQSRMPAAPANVLYSLSVNGVDPNFIDLVVSPGNSSQLTLPGTAITNFNMHIGAATTPGMTTADQQRSDFRWTFHPQQRRGRPVQFPARQHQRAGQRFGHAELRLGQHRQRRRPQRHDHDHQQRQPRRHEHPEDAGSDWRRV